MGFSLEQFLKLLEESGILADETIKEFVPPNAFPKDGQELARALVRNKKLTKFQAEEIYKGKGGWLVLGNYILLQKIGAEVNGTVFLAEHRRMKRLVVIKMFSGVSMQDQSAVARFHQGVEAAARLRHPNIVAVDDADCYSGFGLLVMERVNGSDLSALVKKDGPFSVDAAVNIVLQAAQGLAAAHAEGIVHGDIKPANLLLDKNGTVKIVGMGLASINSAVGAVPRLEMIATDPIMETADYMARAQASDMKMADARADIYSLGCTLFYLLTGRPAYDGETSTAPLLAHQNEPVRSLRALCPSVPEPLEAIFSRMVAKNVDDRYQTITDAVADIERCGVSREHTVTLISGLKNWVMRQS